MPRTQNQETRSVLLHWQEDVPDDRLAHLIRDTGRMLKKSLQARLAEHSVSFGHWSFLRILWVTEGLTQRELSEQAGLMEPTTFTALKAMEANGLIERRQLNGNRKNIHIYLTQKGKNLKKTLIPLAEEVNDIAVQGVEYEDLRVTRNTLLKILSNLVIESE
ncbi:MarR family winged helix-turn-helix transcriptional regulator [Vreelandella nanhaiensis]|uniref:MarR family transcriptional regulator n=1 Tax=Vreelandella nanhaiensis TaxID=1258546 RepID=A0A433KT48_9GAMM|nr:MarR family transcriptional regulator [Halomonas nanhaiensis]RUR32691.1 MarR family transcriptional regulator [Halomonas nanhaiensis]